MCLGSLHAHLFRPPRRLGAFELRTLSLMLPIAAYLNYTFRPMIYIQRMLYTSAYKRKYITLFLLCMQTYVVTQNTVI